MKIMFQIPDHNNVFQLRANGMYLTNYVYLATKTKEEIIQHASQRQKKFYLASFQQFAIYNQTKTISFISRLDSRNDLIR